MPHPLYVASYCGHVFNISAAEGILNIYHHSQILLLRASKDFPAQRPPPLRFIRSCSSSLAPATLKKLEAVFKVPVLEVRHSSHVSRDAHPKQAI